MLTGNEIVAEKADIPESMKEGTEYDEHETKKETKEEDNSTSNKLIELLQERLKIYEIAEQKAKRNDETSRARRYNRGIKTLKEMLVSVQSGESVNEADIPAALPSSAITESTVQNIGNTHFMYTVSDFFTYECWLCVINLIFYFKEENFFIMYRQVF